mmetsp:Transcript_7639/g.17288  ORF Transcript_7639/g.17288 Transcript_7639/m.17288 type:complete len:100 (-) Transcript_7639:651-950(-)
MCFSGLGRGLPDGKSTGSDELASPVGEVSPGSGDADFFVGGCFGGGTSGAGGRGGTYIGGFFACLDDDDDIDRFLFGGWDNDTTESSCAFVAGSGCACC